MHCPACSRELTAIRIRDIELDICKDGCGGIWFDQFEFKKFDKPHEFAGEELLNLEARCDSSVDHEEKRSCATCTEAMMLR